jgi:hypothetical protein
MVRPLLLVLALLFPTPDLSALASDRAEGNGTAAATQPESPPLDPVVAAVVRMLDEGVTSDTIAEWLLLSGASPATPTPDDLIALARAGASEELVRRILELAPASPRKALAPPDPAERPPKPDEQRPPPPAGATPEPSAVWVEFDISYASEMVEDEPTPWDLFVYLDGHPLASCDDRSSNSTAHCDPLVFRELLLPGRHVIRLLQEQHELRSRRKGTWSHEARVFPDPIPFNLDSGGAWRVAIRVKESDAFWKSGTTEYAVIHDDDPVEVGVKPGPRRRTWFPLCEELEAELSPRKLDSNAGRRALEGCVRWDSLWEGVEDHPDRTAVRDEMTDSDFNPVPSESR